jgi:hypothetical protein
MILGQTEFDGHEFRAGYRKADSPPTLLQSTSR